MLEDLIVLPSREDRRVYADLIRGRKGWDLKKNTIRGSSGNDRIGFLHPDYNPSWVDDSGVDGGLSANEQEFCTWAVHLALSDHRQQLQVFETTTPVPDNQLNHTYTRDPQNGGEPFQATTLELSPLLFVALFEIGHGHHIQSHRKDKTFMEWVEAFSFYLQWGKRGDRVPGVPPVQSVVDKWKTLDNINTCYELTQRLDEQLGGHFDKCYIEVAAPRFKSRFADINPATSQ